MYAIKLNDILHLSDEEINYAKVFLNMNPYDIKNYNEDLNEPVNKNVGFSYYSHQGKRRNLYEGQLVLGFLRIAHDTWLFITAGRVTKVPELENKGPSEFVLDDRFKALFGRLIMHYKKGNKFSRYSFKLKKIIDEFEVQEILPKYYESIEFKGFENVHLTFNQLENIISGTRFEEYKSMLNSVKCVYCLTDTKTGKLYIGSAYGENGVAQRWSDYLSTSTGGNKELIKLYNDKGENYFKENFEFTILEYFPKKFNTSFIVDRETYWKNCLSTKKYGYNDN